MIPKDKATPFTLPIVYVFQQSCYLKDLSYRLQLLDDFQEIYLACTVVHLSTSISDRLLAFPLHSKCRRDVLCTLNLLANCTPRSFSFWADGNWLYGRHRISGNLQVGIWSGPQFTKMSRVIWPHIYFAVKRRFQIGCWELPFYNGK